MPRDYVPVLCVDVQDIEVTGSAYEGALDASQHFLEDRIFKRAATSLQLNFRLCHPKESLDKVEKIVEEMKSGARDKARFWIDLPIGEGGAIRKVPIEFFALRDRDGSYLGCLEYTRDIEDERNLQGQKRLLD